MTKTRDEFVQGLMNKMSLAEKVGQCFIFSWRGNMVTPSVIELVERLHAGGFRIEPYTTESATALYYGRELKDPNFVEPPDYFTTKQTYFKAGHPGAYTPPAEYATRLNQLQDVAMAKENAIPLQITLDYEGDYSHDYAHGGMNMFISAMGLTACNDLDLIYRTGKSMAAQLAAVGVNMLHSPVCDVNTNPENAGIGIRSFGDTREVCAQNACRLFEGIRDGGLIAVAKHFPGQGDTSKDSHDSLGFIDVDRETLHTRELYPFKELIVKGLPALMTAHVAYPAYDSKEIPATLSHKIMTGLVREELGFDGLIISDALGMGAIVNNWGIPRASVMALQAGCDQLLVKNDEVVRAQSFFAVKQAVEKGELSEERLDESVCRILNAKYDQGLFETGGNVDPQAAPTVIRSPEVTRPIQEAAEKAMILIRDEENLLPLSPDRSVLVIEQVTPLEFTPNDTFCNSHLFNQAMIEESLNVINATTSFQATEAEEALLLDVANEVDTVVITNFFWRICPANNVGFVQKLIAAGKKVVVVTNTPYAKGNVAEAGTVLCTFSGTPASLKSAAQFLYGKLEAPGTWPLLLSEP